MYIRMGLHIFEETNSRERSVSPKPHLKLQPTRVGADARACLHVPDSVFHPPSMFLAATFIICKGNVLSNS